MTLLDSVALRDEVRQKIREIEQADIVVGIPSYNNARTIGHVVHAVQAGLAKYFPSHRCVLVNSDMIPINTPAKTLRHAEALRR